MLLDRLRRVTRDNHWIAEIDGLRFVAIASVVLFHTFAELHLRTGTVIPVEPRYSAFFGLIEQGNRGVNLFFIISGFVLALPFARHFLTAAREVSLRKYFLRRVTRLEPPYILSVLIFVGMLLAYNPHPGADFAGHAMATAVYMHSLVYGQMTKVNTVSWSLEVEIQFYILAPLFMQIYRVSNAGLRRALLCAIIIGVSLAQAGISSTRTELTLLYFVQFFLMGLLIADLYITSGDRIQPSYLWDGAGLAGLLLSFGLPKTFAVEQVFLPWLMVGIFGAALRGKLLRKFFANPWIAVIGGMCYSIYLLHLQFIAAIFKVTRQCILPQSDFMGNFIIQLVVTVLPVMAISIAFFVLVERPCMNPAWPSKLWNKITGRSRAEATVFDSSGISAERLAAPEPAGAPAGLTLEPQTDGSQTMN